MAQFDVYRNKNPATRELYPLLVDVQADLLADLQTRVVAPLTQSRPLLKRPLATLTPVIKVQGEDYLLVTPELAGVAKSALGARISGIREHRDKIIAALDLLVTGT